MTGQELVMGDNAAQMLSELKASSLFTPDFPKRTAWDSRSGLPSPALAAINLTRSERPRLEAIVRTLGEQRYFAAIPVLSQLWRECALEPVRNAAGHALLAMQTPDAWDALEAILGDADHLSVFLGVSAVFARDAGKAYDYFEPYFAGPAGSPVPSSVLRLLAPWCFSAGGEPEWRDHAQSWLAHDPRWLLLCARLRRDRELGAEARNVLRHAPAAARIAALDQVRREEVKHNRPPAPPSVLRTGNLLARYEKGEFQSVWRDIRSHAGIDGDFRAEVLEVACATMRRAARNADLLAARLSYNGWRALPVLDDRLRTAPSPDDEAIFQRIEDTTSGPVPPSVLAFWRIAGGINFVWDYNCELPALDFGTGLHLDKMDPLCIDPPAAVLHNLETWEEQKNEPDPDLIEPFSLDLAPDHLHKANISGGLPYGVELPFRGADPVLDGERAGLPFTDYLRMSFRWAGFPGLQYHSDQAAAARFVRLLGQGFEPF
jgi:hypothetical protein